jgi:hypothetical protein
MRKFNAKISARNRKLELHCTSHNCAPDALAALCSTHLVTQDKASILLTADC